MTSLSRRRLAPLAVLLAATAAIALAQQQILLRRAGRLVSLEAEPALGPAPLLRLRFSRPVQPVVELLDSAGQPTRSLPLRGEEREWRLSLEAEAPISRPLQLRVTGVDAAGRPIRARQFIWDPRPTLLAKVARGQRERLELRDPDGRWHPLTSWRDDLTEGLPLEDGRGVLFTTDDAPLRARVWRIGVVHNRLWDPGRPRPALRLTPARDLLGATSTFLHGSSSAMGRLLLQGARLAPEEGGGGSQPWLRLLEEKGRTWRTLPFESGGTATLLPTGDGVILQVAGGLTLYTLPPLGQRQSFLPGRHDLLAFCGLGERALMLARKADFSRDVELLRPGQPPVRIWTGRAAVVGASCSANAERVWLLTVEQGSRDDGEDAGGAQRLEVVTVRPEDGTSSPFRLQGWMLTAGSGLSFDPVSQSLLATLSRPGDEQSRAVLVILAQNGEPTGQTSLARPLLEASWLPARGRLGDFSSVF